jgi:hypothetical protein
MVAALPAMAGTASKFASDWLTFTGERQFHFNLQYLQ